MADTPTPTRYRAAPTPSPSAEIRSQAIAKLKRAASNPRTPDGRRPPNLTTRVNGPSVTPNDVDRGGGGSSAEGASPSSPVRPSMGHDYGDEELLSPSPGGPLLHHGPGAAAMQRSQSDSPSFAIPATSPHIAYASANSSPFFTAQPSPVNPSPDWAAYQLAQSYLPSISPVPAPPSSFPAKLQASNAVGRNTPSPLPTLGELRNLSRSNSAAARANAMNKLVGGGGGHATPTRSTNVGTPLSSEEDVTLTVPGLRPSLYRSGTIGVPRMFGIASDVASDSGSVDDQALVSQIPDTQFDVPRPRLQRSFTVSSSNMGEERRSAVGRRMVERLAERRAARQKEEAEVRKLWEERRHTRGSAKLQVDEPPPESPPSVPAAAPAVHASVNGDTSKSLLPGSRVPAVAGMAAGGAAVGVAAVLGRDLLSVADHRTSSRNTERSDDVFEFQSHLSRNISTRTHKTEIPEPSPTTRPSRLNENPKNDHNGYTAGGAAGLSSHHGEDDRTPLDVPDLSMITPPKPKHGDKESRKYDPVNTGGPRPYSSASDGLDGRSSYYSRNSQSTDGDDNSLDGGGHYWEQGPTDDVVDKTHVNGRSLMGSYTERDDENSPSRISHEKDIETSSASHQSHTDKQRGHVGSLSRQSPVDIRANSQQSWNEGEQSSHYLTPNGPRVHKKSSSVSKMRDMFQSMRRPSAQKVSRGNTPPLTPPNDDSGFNGRTSGHSATGHEVQRRPSDSRNANKQPQSRPLSPMGPTQQEANKLLIHHQLSSASTPVSFLPRANVNDPRVLNSKLSPFPGIAALEQKNREQDPRLAPADSGSSALTPAPPAPGGSNNSSASRGWANKEGTRLSGTSSGRGSHSDAGHAPSRNGNHGNNIEGYKAQRDDTPPRESPASTASNAADQYSPTPAGMPRSGGSLKQRPEIPSFMMNRRRAPPPPPLDVAESNVVSINDESPTTERPQTSLPLQSRDVSRRMAEMLEMPVNDPERPDFLDDPPRKLLLAQQVLQVVNSNTVKDRYLLLFNDILVIAKPLISNGETAADLDTKFVVKSIVSLDKLAISSSLEDQSTEARGHPLVQQFTRDFAEDGARAIRSLTERSNPRIRTSILADLLIRTPELDKSQLGLVLASDQNLLLAFIAKFDFARTSIDDALRMFLLAVRLPTDIARSEVLLRGFAKGYYAANEGYVNYDQTLAGDLVVAILELNDMLYSTFGYAFPNHAVSRDSFISAFRKKDPHGLVSDHLLEAIFSSVRGRKLVQALAPHEAHLARPVVIEPARLPSRICHDEWSHDITVTLPRTDSHFRIGLYGNGLEFDPPVLDFSESSSRSFRVRGVELGTKTFHFDRMGTTAPLYSSLGNGRTIHVEQGFMRHTFRLSFVSPSGKKATYCYSVTDAPTLQQWSSMLSRHIWLTTERKQGAGAPTSSEGKTRTAAEAVSLQVLRDALMPSETVQDAGQASLDKPGRVTSVSIAYHTKQDSLGPLPPTHGARTNPSLIPSRTGKELVVLCRQNSLLPSVLQLLQSSAEPQSAPLLQQQANFVDTPSASRLGTFGVSATAGTRSMMHDRRL